MNKLRAHLRDEWNHDVRLGLQSLANTSDGEDLLRAVLLHFNQACAAQEKRIQELESERTGMYCTGEVHMHTGAGV